ncbi:MAG: CocE/NonD family hydrolase [Caldimonas sp.]
MLPPRTPLSASAILLAVALGLCPLAEARNDDKPDRSLRESVHSVPVPGTGAEIVVTTYRPRGSGPFPWIVLSHGTAVTRDANQAIGRYRSLHPIREWVKRGYAVVVPVRRGYGASGGPKPGDGYGSCARPDFGGAGEAAALDLLTTVAWAKKTQPDLDARRWLLVGQSSGGFASIYAASKRPDGLVAVLAFAPGRGGNPETRPGEPCASDRMAALFASIAPQIAVPVLWFYAENDQFIGPRAQKLWFESFRSAGGRGTLVVVPPFPERLGHGVFPAPAGLPLWTAEVDKFFKAQRLGLPF